MTLILRVPTRRHLKLSSPRRPTSARVAFSAGSGARRGLLSRRDYLLRSPKEVVSGCLPSRGGLRLQSREFEDSGITSSWPILPDLLRPTTQWQLHPCPV